MDFDLQRWKSVKALFFEALDQPTGERDSFLIRESLNDPELRELLLEMLAQHDRSVEGFEGDSVRPQFPNRIGPYKSSHLVASTLTTIVVRADRDDGQFAQPVAIKLIHPSAVSRENLLRMESEHRILASLNHPAICRLLDSGQLSTGQHYLILEWIDGVSFLEHAAPLNLRAKLLLFQQICIVIEAAHRLLIVHRDLKPAHILVTPEGNLKVLDFGIAKLLEDSEATQYGKTQLTPAYACPEQWSGQPVTPGFDVFSLGVLFYELVSGRHPLGAAVAQPHEWEKLQLKLADRRLTSIAVQATHTDPVRRYPSVEALRRDIENYLDNKPLSAADSTLFGDCALCIKRHRAFLIPLALCVLFAAYEFFQLTNRRELERERG